MSVFHAFLLSTMVAVEPSTEAAPLADVSLETARDEGDDTALLEKVLATTDRAQQDGLMASRMQVANESAKRWADVQTILHAASADADPSLVRILCVTVLTGTDEQRAAALKRADHLHPTITRPPAQGRVCFYRPGSVFGAADRIQIDEVLASKDPKAQDGDRSERRMLDTSEDDSGLLQLGNGRRACFSTSVGTHIYEGVALLPAAAPLLVPVGTLITNPILRTSKVSVAVVADQASYVSAEFKIGSQAGAPVFGHITAAFGLEEYNSLRDERSDYCFVYCVKPDGTPLP